MRHLMPMLAGLSTVVGLITAALAQPPAWPDYPRETELLVDTPGTSGSIAAGLFNPASWAVQRHGGAFFAWNDPRGDAPADWTGVVSARHLGLGLRRFRFAGPDGGELHVDDWTLGLAAGTRGSALGLAYSWAGGDLDAAPRHERLAVGSVQRLRWGSLGTASIWDLERRDNLLQIDLGLRPLGPRWTLFGDAVYRRGESFEDIRTGFGLELRPLPGLAVAARGRSTGELSLAVNLGLAPGLTAGFRPHLDDAGERRAATWTAELHPDTAWLGTGRLERGRRWPELRFDGPLAYRRYRWFDKRRTLLATLSELAAAAGDARVGGVVLNLSGLRAGAEMQWELRAQLAGLRAAGKKVVVYVDTPNFWQYALASVADELWIDPLGGIDVRGVHSGSTYLRHTLQKLGLGVEEWRYFTYKSAFESLARDRMSPADREQRQALVDDLYEEVARQVTTSRRLERAAWDRIVDEHGVLLPHEAQGLGLVDSIGDFERAKRSARRAARRTSGDVSAARLDGVLGDPVWGPEEWGAPGRIAVLYAIGPTEMDDGIRARTLAQAIRAARDARNVRAVVLRADSPGGDALASDLVARELRSAARRKPVVVSQGGVAASGGYWISMYGDPIVASPLTVTASIGVIAGWIWNDSLSAKTGLTYDHVERGAHADFGHGLRLPYVGVTVPDRPPSPEERARAEQIIRSVYREFVSKVAAARGLSEARVDSIGQGRVWSGRRALDLGLVDELGGLWRSLELAKQAAGLPASRPVELAEAPELGAIDWNRWRPRLPGFGAAPAVVGPETGPLRPDEIEFLRRVFAAPGRPLPLLEPLDLNDPHDPPR